MITPKNLKAHYAVWSYYKSPNIFKKEIEKPDINSIIPVNKIGKYWLDWNNLLYLISNNKRYFGKTYLDYMLEIKPYADKKRRILINRIMRKYIKSSFKEEK